MHYIWRVSKTLTLHFNADLGCEGFITPYFLDASKYLALPSLDPSSGTIFGRSVKIFSAFIESDSAASLLIDTIMKDSLSQKTPVVVRNATGDPYFLDEAVRNWGSSYNVLSTVLSIFSLFCLWDSCRVFVKFYRIQKGKLPLRSYCTFSLVMIVLSNAAMFVKSIDIIGVCIERDYKIIATTLLLHSSLFSRLITHTQHIAICPGPRDLPQYLFPRSFLLHWGCQSLCSSQHIPLLDRS